VIRFGEFSDFYILTRWRREAQVYVNRRHRYVYYRYDSLIKTIDFISYFVTVCFPSRSPPYLFTYFNERRYGGYTYTTTTYYYYCYYYYYHVESAWQTNTRSQRTVSHDILFSYTLCLLCGTYFDENVADASVRVDVNSPRPRANAT